MSFGTKDYPSRMQTYLVFFLNFERHGQKGVGNIAIHVL